MKQAKRAKFAYVQSGYCVFGLGSTCNAAILDACRWLEPSEIENDDGSISFISGRKNAEMLLEQSGSNHGDMKIIERNDPEWNAYVKGM